MEILLNNWQSLGLFVLLIILLTSLISAAGKERNRKKREFDRKLETVLQPRETVKLICPQKGGRVILTSRRLLFETGRGFQSLPFKNITKAQGMSRDGKKTADPDKMASLTLKADKDYTIVNTTPEFTQLAKQLIRKVDNQNKKKTENAGKKK